MEIDKSILLQKQVRDNSEDLQSEFLNMKNWEEEMKKADMEIRNAGGDQILPPVRRKKKASKETTKLQSKENSAVSKRIKSSDYSTWDKFDVNKACEEVDKVDDSDEVSEEPLSKEELERNHAEATEYKIKGNNLVKKEKWVEAIGCYSKAIKVFPYDAVFFANRALCHLKIDNLHSADADATAAVQLDEFYVKGYHRRATARIALKQYQEAAQDLKKILKLEPSNKEAASMLASVTKSIENSKPVIISSMRDQVEEPRIEKKIGEKLWGGAKNDKKVSQKSSIEEKISSKKGVEEMKAVDIKENTKGVEERKAVDMKENMKVETNLKLPEWLPETVDDVDIVEAIKKLPHQRSKKPLRTVPIKEIHFGIEKSTLPDAKSEETVKKDEVEKEPPNRLVEQKTSCDDIPPVPKTAVQFLLTWRMNKSTEFRYEYLKQIPAQRIPILFQDSMESNVFSDILKILRSQFTKSKLPVYDYLKYLSEVKRFRTLTMFMTKSDKEDIQELFDYSKKFEGQSDDVIKDLRVKYEL